MTSDGKPGRGRPVGSDRVLTERRLFASATELFATRGYYGVGIREIATASGFTVASLYHYVGSKEELLERIMHRALDAFTAGAERAVRASDDPVEQLAGLVEMSVLFHVNNAKTARVVDKEVGALGREARARVIEIRDDYERRWTSVLESGVASGQFYVPNVSLARLALLGMCAEVAYWYSPTGPVDIMTLRDNFVDMALALIKADSAVRPPALVEERDIPSLSLEAAGMPPAPPHTSHDKEVP
jgi:AcrR family transcriptional regulator